MKTILLDADGVLVDWLTPALEGFAHRPGIRLDRDRLTEWGLVDAIRAADPDLDAEDEVRTMIDTVDLRDLVPLPGAADAVRTLRARAEVYVVTAALDVRARAENLDAHFGLTVDRIVSASAKHLVRGDAFLDDRPDHVRRWASAWPHGRAYVFDAPYNRQDTSSNRVYGWTPQTVARLLGNPFLVDRDDSSGIRAVSAGRSDPPDPR